ncbi:hypothetical protein XELAEV_18014616mg [Xenopus laevis]|uniref:Uncharacterized protein n=1 Tax=Xenopus laevis TaxID=8355 RepID=A0A974DJ42_XENLA|nr:hypothetical protein XELAEV_18014616mg [Xenopus laevis]
MIVDKYINAATRIPRSHLLQYKQKPKINRVPLVVTYNPQLSTLRKIARELQGTLHKDERLKSIFPDPPLLAFRQPPNLKSLITRSALLQPTKMEHTRRKKQCKTCPHILNLDKIPILDTLEEYSIHGHYNCSTSNVVYLIQCTKCITGGLSIGDTGQSLRKRNTHHRFTITNKKRDTPIGKHFNSPYHSIKDLRILGANSPTSENLPAMASLPAQHFDNANSLKPEALASFPGKEKLVAVKILMKMNKEKNEDIVKEAWILRLAFKCIFICQAHAAFQSQVK